MLLTVACAMAIHRSGALTVSGGSTLSGRMWLAGGGPYPTTTDVVFSGAVTVPTHFTFDAYTTNPTPAAGGATDPASYGVRLGGTFTGSTGCSVELWALMRATVSPLAISGPCSLVLSHYTSTFSPSRCSLSFFSLPFVVRRAVQWWAPAVRRCSCPTV